MSERYDVISAVRAVLPRVAAHQKFTKRTVDAIREALPGYTVHHCRETIGPAGIRIWGKGITYEDCISLTWYDDTKPWVEALAYSLDREDPSDGEERAEQESALVPRLTEIEAQIAALRAEAAAMFAALPTPKSAKLRADRCFWENPSYAIRKVFPLTL